jgi:hypothetical protein
MSKNQTAETLGHDAELLDLGVVLGQTHAFALVAGRCSAAQAEGLRRMRQEKLYLRCARSWTEFCPQYLKISRVEADRTIKLLEEFGPEYFDLSQLTRISAETYRAIAPAVKDGALHVNGEAIALIPENSRRVSAAIAELRQAARQGLRGLRMQDRIVKLDKRCTELIADFREIARTEAQSENRVLFTSALVRAHQELRRIALECGLP